MSLNSALLSAVCVVAAPLSAQIRDFSFDLEALGGQSIKASDFRDNVLIVDFWGTWCPPCRQALPGMVALYRKYKHHGLEIVGLNYENNNDLEDAAETVRAFAAEVGITYQLALGTPEVQVQVPRFSGYPTVLLFKRGLEHAKTVVGYTPGHEDELEAWVRAALELDDEGIEESRIGDPHSTASGPSRETIEEAVPEGLIYRPGNSDHGFDFELEDVDGVELAFADLRGKPVLLAITSTWDEDAEATAVFLQKLHERHGSKTAILAASIEIESEPEKRTSAIRAFQDRHRLAYRILPVDLSFTRKRIHRFAGVPTMLVFDHEGTLVLRESGSSPEIHALVQKAILEQIAGR